MRRILTSCLFLFASALIQAQIREYLPPARPLFNFPDTATIFLMGDVMMHADQITNARQPDGDYSFDTYFRHLEDLISSSDLAVANMEFTLAGKPYTGYPCFSAPDGYETYVAGCGVDVFLTANNHILDKGRKGLERTLERYSEMEGKGMVKHTGASVSPEDDDGRFPLMVVVRGVRIAFVNFTYGTNLEAEEGFPKVHVTDRKEIAAAIRRAREAGAEFVVALPHWGTEYVLRHSRSQEDLANWLVGQGCDAVVGAHPHVVQDCETIGTVPVVYSMGNAVSNMSARNTQIGMAVRLRIVTDWRGERKMAEPEFIFTWCSRPGTLTDSYSVVPVKEFIGKRELWKTPSDYDNMVLSYGRVKVETGIID
jgi:poly-gamma-glutamate synthesis protein (capsule biosynthesis protein)